MTSTDGEIFAIGDIAGCQAFYLGRGGRLPWLCKGNVWDNLPVSCQSSNGPIPVHRRSRSGGRGCRLPTRAAVPPIAWKRRLRPKCCPLAPRPAGPASSLCNHEWMTAFGDWRSQAERPCMGPRDRQAAWRVATQLTTSGVVHVLGSFCWKPPYGSRKRIVRKCVIVPFGRGRWPVRELVG